RLSARNLLHYLALRQRDRRSLQDQLAVLGLSSLGRAEAHALATVEAVLVVLHALVDPGAPVPPLPAEAAPDFESGPRLLAEHSDTCLGRAPAERDVRIMVTMPSEAATDYPLVEGLLRQGMDCMRINCAHDDAAAWQQMITHLRRAELALGKSCKISMDLAGPKLRTQGLPPGPAVLRIGPVRNNLGQIQAPARLWLTPQELPQPAPAEAAASLVFPAAWLTGLHPAAAVSFVDARGAARKLRVQSVSPAGCWVELRKTAYLTPLTRFQGPAAEATIQGLPRLESFLLLRPGDTLRLTSRPLPGGELTGQAAGVPAVIGCTLPEVLDAVLPGARIWFDDGKIGGVVDRVEPGTVHVRITQARAQGDKLRNDKGINLPDSRLPLAALTEKDLQDLTFVSQHADIVALSFVNDPADVDLLQQHLNQLSDRKLPIILKIETRRGFEQLPALLLSAMKAESCGIMIARGDLAVECGFERMAEVQEEILWLCEAAHVPVIWATQVLESLARGGLPSRAEITDAAMGDRAECVMLNKGPRMEEAVRILGDILGRMQAHQHKKSAMLRSLHVAQL
ncbi:MAG: pyruvate kinase, partial [Hymenobacter sp.]|nr:pyruvate kinase [Hymenobacter sp.]